MTELKVRYAIPPLVFFILLFLGLALVMLNDAMTDLLLFRAGVIGWSSVDLRAQFLFWVFILCVLWPLYLLIDRRPLIILNSSGVENRVRESSYRKQVLWGQIESVHQFSHLADMAIGINYKPDFVVRNGIEPKLQKSRVKYGYDNVIFKAGRLLTKPEFRTIYPYFPDKLKN